MEELDASEMSLVRGIEDIIRDTCDRYCIPYHEAIALVNSEVDLNHSCIGLQKLLIDRLESSLRKIPQIKEPRGQGDPVCAWKELDYFSLRWSVREKAERLSAVFFEVNL
jgi:hypothetical protein